jgi:large subunit ribosomal protein L24
MKIKKNDTVKIMVGDDKGKTGKVLKVFPKTNKVLVEGLNMVKKHVKPTRGGKKGQTIEIALPMSASNVAVK